MPAGMPIAQVIAIASPLVALELGLAIYCVVKIVKEGTANLNKVAWCLIVCLVNIFGPIAFLLVGKRRDR
jgi:hypothetical protein